MGGRWCWGPLFAVLLCACRGGVVDVGDWCKPRAAEDKHRAKTIDAADAAVLPNGRVLRPAGRVVAEKQLGYPVDMVAHPLLPLVYVSDVRYHAKDQRCDAGAFPRGLHVVALTADGGQVQSPEGDAGLVPLLPPNTRPADLPAAARCGDSPNAPRDAAFGMTLDRCGQRLYASSGLSGYVHVYTVRAAPEDADLDAGADPADASDSVDGAASDASAASLITADAFEACKERLGQCGQLVHERAIHVDGYTAGVALSPDESELYVVQFMGRNGGPSRVRRFLVKEPATEGKRKRYELDSLDVDLGEPGGYAITTTREPNGFTRVWVTGFRDGQVATFVALPEGDPEKTLQKIDVGKNPEDVITLAGSDHVLVSVSDDDSVVELAINHEGGKSEGRLQLIHRTPVGSTCQKDQTRNCIEKPGASPSGLVQDPHDGRVYVVRSADNAVAVLERNASGRFEVSGSVPVGWTPTQPALVPLAARACSELDVRPDRSLVVTNAKTSYGPETPGGLPLPSDAGTAPPSGNEPFENQRDYFESGKMQGSLSAIPLLELSGEALKKHSDAVIQHVTVPVGTYDAGCGKKPFPVPPVTGGPTPIRHVVLIVRENKTYDFLLGAVPNADGEAAYAADEQRKKRDLPPITANINALAKRFANHDNFYADGQVSMQGHGWLTASFVNDYLERIHTEESNGNLLGVSFDEESGLPAAYPGFGNFFTHLLRHKKSFIIFNEIVGALASYGDSYVLNHIASDTGFQDRENMTDLERVKKIGKRLIDDDQFPSFAYVLLPRDHTEGVQPGELSPSALIAENDYATGMLVEKISRSKYWPTTAIFIVQDDALQGYDHVDKHRTICVVVSPWARPGTSSVHASFPGLYRTIEHILGVPPMNRFDRYAPLLMEAFTTKPNKAPFFALPPQAGVIDEITPAASSAAQALSVGISEEALDAHENPTEFSDIVWWSITGDAQAKARLDARAASAPQPSPDVAGDRD